MEKSRVFVVTLRHPSGLQGKRLSLSKIGRIRINLHREIIGEIKTCIVTLRHPSKGCGFSVRLDQFPTWNHPRRGCPPHFLSQSFRFLNPSHRNQPSLQDVDGGVNVPVDHKSAERTVVNPLIKPLPDDLPAPATFLARSPRLDCLDGGASIRSFAPEPLKKQSPPGVQDVHGLRTKLIALPLVFDRLPDQSHDVKVLDDDGIELLDQHARKLPVEVPPATLDLQVLPDQLLPLLRPPL